MGRAIIGDCTCHAYSRSMEMTTPPPAGVTEASTHFWTALRASIGRAVIGADEALRLITLALLADGHVLI